MSGELVIVIEQVRDLVTVLDGPLGNVDFVLADPPPEPLPVAVIIGAPGSAYSGGTIPAHTHTTSQITDFNERVFDFESLFDAP